MPDPALYLKAMSVGAMVSFVCWGILSVACAAWDARRQNAACVLAMSCGLAGGLCVFPGDLSWAPSNALDRFLLILLPAVLAVELFVGLRILPRRMAWLLRATLVVAIPRIVLHGSVYLSEGAGGWKAIVVCAACISCLWWLLEKLAERSLMFARASVPLSVHAATFAAGLCIMMAGYIKGGATAFPLTACLVTTLVVAFVSRRSSRQAESKPSEPSEPHAAARPTKTAKPHEGETSIDPILSVSVITFASLLMIGHFFGDLSTRQTLVILLTPLMGWVTELPQIGLRNPWLVGAVRIVLVLVPLVAVISLAKRDFDREMGPLLRGSAIDVGHVVVTQFCHEVLSHPAHATRPGDSR